MEPFSVVLILLAGLWAGTINAVVGSGTLVTFPVLVALGYPPVTASISNATGLIAGGISGVWGYRRELAGMRPVLVRLLPAAMAGGVTGAALLLNLPERVFGIAAPFLVTLALVFVVLQPRLQDWVRKRQVERALDRPHPWLLTILVFLAGIYGGYFVAAQGILLFGILGVFLHGSLQQANGVRGVLVLGVNVIAAVSYLIFAFDRIDWVVVALIAVSSLVGGSAGAAVGRRLPPALLRGVVVAMGLVALVSLVARL